MLNATTRKNLLESCGNAIDNAYSDGWSDGYAKARQDYADAGKGIAKCERATPEEVRKWGSALFGFCTECHKAIEGRWVGLGNFCPWCGRAMEWHDKEEKEDEQ